MARRLSLTDVVGAVAIAAALVLVRLPERGLRPQAERAQLSAMEDPSPLEQLRRQLALAVGENAVFDGWTRAGGRQRRRPARHRPGPGAARHAQDPGGDDRRLHPGGRPRAGGLVHAGAARRHEDPREDPRARSGTGSRSWGRRARRCGARSRSSPCRRTCRWRCASRGARADLMWRIAGDTSTDFNHYTKRMTLGAVYGSTLLVVARRPERGLDRHRRLPRPAHRRRDAVREVQGRLARLVRAAEPVALSRAAALPAKVNCLSRPVRPSK